MYSLWISPLPSPTTHTNTNSGRASSRNCNIYRRVALLLLLPSHVPFLQQQNGDTVGTLSRFREAHGSDDDYPELKQAGLIPGFKHNTLI
jgi:hypothetical protein